MANISSVFNTEGPLYTFGIWVYRFFLLNVLWIVFGLPLFTIGASTTAAFYVTNKWVQGEDVSITQGFYRSFKQNFWQATIIWVIIVVLFQMILTNLQSANFFGSISQAIFYLEILALVELTLTCLYIFPLLARHHVSVFGAFRSAFFMVNRHLLTTIMLLIGLSGLIVGTYYVGVLLLFLMSLYAWWVSYLLIPIFKRYTVTTIK